MCQMCNLYSLDGENDILDDLHLEPSEIERVNFANYEPQDISWVRTGTPFSFSSTSSDDSSDLVETTYVPAYPAADSGDSASVSGNGNPIIEGVLSGVQWTVGVTVTFSFPDESTDYGTGYPGDANNEGFAQTSATQQALIRAALDGETWFSFEGFTLANVVDMGESADAMIRSAYSTDAGGSAYAYYPSDSETGGDMWFGPSNSYDYANPVLGSTSWRSTLHEIGHALGLSHGHTADGGFNALPDEYDHHEYSLMTYNSYEGTTSSYSNDTWSYPQSFMMADIAALQYMYGADFSLNGGDTVYTFSDTTGEMFIDGVGQGTPGGNKIFLTLWDGDGIDTYDLSNYTNTVLITLEAGEASEFSHDQLADLGGGPNGGLARGNVYNALMYDDGTGDDIRSLIENAIGGSGSDIIGGNQVDNVLTGNDGHDALIGFQGDDTIYGGNGADLVLGAEDNDVLYGGNGDDRIYGDVYELPLGTGLIYDATGALSNTTLATAYSVDSEFTYDIWYVPSLFTEADEIVQHAGFTPYVTVLGEGQGDVMYYSFTILEDNTRVVLDIDGGNGLGDGGDFDSYLSVFDAAGTLLVTGDDSQISDGSGGSYDTYDSFIDMTVAVAGVYYVAVDSFARTGVALDATFGLNISVYGEVDAPLVADTLDGSGGQDTLYGGGGQDDLYGGVGDDYLNGGTGNDFVYGGDGDDTLIMASGDGSDSFYGGTGTDTADFSGMTGLSVTLDLGGDVYGFGGAGTYVLSGFENAIGGDDDDTLLGSTGGNNLVGNAGEDIISGGNGSDSLYGGNGADSLFGGNGDDIMDGGNGADFLAGWNGSEIMHGRAGQDHLRGQGGEDSLVGGEGQDRLEGGGEADLLLGGNGQDKLFGGNGRDVLNGGVGNDLYNGGVGSDTFVFSGNFGDDRVQDFDATDNAEDIDLSAVASITNWTDLSTAANGHMYTAGGDVIIDDLGGNTIRLVGVNIADLNAND
ncbi:MAG: M10 family metallopeptidase C-terminal domain-containing protein, partial [Octadecabacter sp.]